MQNVSSNSHSSPSNEAGTPVNIPARAVGTGWRAPKRWALVALLGGALWIGLVPGCATTFTSCEETESCASLGGAGPVGDGLGGTTSDAEGGQGGSGADGGTGSGGTPPACDPREEDCTDQVAFHVSPLGDDGANGAKETPLKTVSYALARVAQRSASTSLGAAAIYVCATEGPYEETLSIGPEHNGVGLFGGFDCNGFEPIDERTEIVAATPAGHRIEGAEGITLGDLHLRSPDATEPGESSFGLWVVESDDVRVVRSEVEAGAGADGAAGEGYDAAAESGAAGNPGVNACVVGGGEVNEGGEPAATFCGGQSTGSVGGRGGPAGISTLPGGPGVAGEVNGGAAGRGEDPTRQNEEDRPCDNGKNGGAGTDGIHGTAPGMVGVLSPNGYVPPDGADGTDGTIGKGGGGGGGAARPSACDTGASGGSGGGGGCPGAGAKGGRGGGASLGVVSSNSTFTLQEVIIITAEGGIGGAGGDGQEGGLRGDGASGGVGASGGNDACDGGNGGRGGNGGSGAGGPGGPSVGVAYVGLAPTLTDVDFEVPSEGAPGGEGGSLNDDGDGPNGLLADTHEF